MAECLRMSEMLEYGDLGNQAARLYSSVLREDVLRASRKGNMPWVHYARQSGNESPYVGTGAQ